MQQQEQQVPPLEQLHSFDGKVYELAEKLVGSKQTKAEVDQTRRFLQNLLRVSSCGTKVFVRGNGFFDLDFESKCILVTGAGDAAEGGNAAEGGSKAKKGPIKYGEADKLHVTYLEAHVLTREWFWGSDSQPLGILDGGDRRAYVSEYDLNRSNLSLININHVAMERTATLMRRDTEESRKRGMDHSYICLAVVRLGKPSVPRGQKPRSIVGAILLDRRPLLVNVTPENPLSTERVYDLLAAGHTLDVCELLYAVLCRVDGLEPKLCANNMGVFVDALFERRDQLPVTAGFCELMRELQSAYFVGPRGHTNRDACAAILRSVLAPHAKERLPEQGPVGYNNVKLDFCNEEFPFYRG